VHALTVYNGELIAGGDFNIAGGNPANSIARWNCNAWQPLGSGTDGGGISALTVFNGELIAGGSFTTAGGVTCHHIARWNGATWQPLGGGLGGLSYPFVYTLTVYPGAPGQASELVAGGAFTLAGDQVSAYWARWRCALVVGDLNCDGVTDVGDINPFVQYLSNFTAWQATYPGCPPQNGDINGDGTYGYLSFGDINPFVLLLTGG
jgi:hypothetical protein